MQKNLKAFDGYNDLVNSWCDKEAFRLQRDSEA